MHKWDSHISISMFNYFLIDSYIHTQSHVNVYHDYTFHLKLILFLRLKTKVLKIKFILFNDVQVT